MNHAERFIIALRDSFQGFDMLDIETGEGNIGVLPAIGSLEQARMAVRKLAGMSGVQRAQFRICEYKLADVLEG